MIEPVKPTPQIFRVTVYVDSTGRQITELEPQGPGPSPSGRPDKFTSSVVVTKTYMGGVQGQKQVTFDIPAPHVLAAFDGYDAALEDARTKTLAAMDEEYRKEVVAASLRLPPLGNPRRFQAP